MTNLVLLNVQDGIATLTLNRPDKRNAMSDEMRTQFVNALESVAADKADIHDVIPRDRTEQLGQPAPVDLDGDHIDMRFGLRHRQRRGSGSASDLQHHRRGPAEPLLGVEQSAHARSTKIFGGCLRPRGLHAELRP